MTISFGNTQISLEDGNTAAPQTQAPAAPAKKGHGKAITGVLLLAGLGAAGYIAAGGASGIQGMVNGGSAAGKTIDTVVNANNKIIDNIGKFSENIGNINENIGNASKDMFQNVKDNFYIDPESKTFSKARALGIVQGAMAGRNAALHGGGKLIQKAAGAASVLTPK